MRKLYKTPSPFGVFCFRLTPPTSSWDYAKHTAHGNWLLYFLLLLHCFILCVSFQCLCYAIKCSIPSAPSLQSCTQPWILICVSKQQQRPLLYGVRSNKRALPNSSRKLLQPRDQGAACGLRESRADSCFKLSYITLCCPNRLLLGFKNVSVNGPIPFAFCLGGEDI